MDRQQLILIGGGGHARACIDVIEQTGLYDIRGILDVQEKVGSRVFGYEIIGTDKNLQPWLAEHAFLITIGHLKDVSRRRELYSMLLQHEAQMPAIISPRAYVSQHAVVGNGTIVMHDAMINAGAKVGANCIVNSKALIEHDAVIGDHCHISTGAIINGGVVVGSGTFLGSNATTKQYISIRDDSFIRAQSLVRDAE